MSNGKAENFVDPFDFHDIVFTLVLTLGLAPEMIGVSHIKGLLSESWIQELAKGNQLTFVGQQATFTFQHLENLLAFIAGLLTLLLSWFGVRESLKKKPMRSDHAGGVLRFAIDVMLIISYGVVIIFFKQIEVVLVMLVGIFVAYVIWDLCKIWEYWQEHYLKSWQKNGFLKTFVRQLVSIVFAIAFLLLYVYFPRVDDADKISLILLVLVFLVVYRFAKDQWYSAWISGVATLAAMGVATFI